MIAATASASMYSGSFGVSGSPSVLFGWTPRRRRLLEMVWVVMTASILAQHCLREIVANQGFLVRLKEGSQLRGHRPDATLCPILMHWVSGLFECSSSTDWNTWPSVSRPRAFASRRAEEHDRSAAGLRSRLTQFDPSMTAHASPKSHWACPRGCGGCDRGTNISRVRRRRART